MTIEFRCNLCGAENSVSDPLKKHRELLHCSACGCCARFRGIVYAIEREVLGAPLRHSAPRKDITGIGFSDAEQYAGELARVFDYKNTFLHTEPMLDLTNADSVSSYGLVDFLVCSDVLEHVPPPSIRAFQNLRKLVRPGGLLILTVPYLEGYETIEHYPHLYRWKTIELSDGRHAVINLRRRAQGDLELECFSDPVFHGGPGQVLEMRVFGEGDLRARLAYAGFAVVEELSPTMSDIGYVWDYNVERPEFDDRRFKSCVLICR